MYEDTPQELVHDPSLGGGLRRPAARPAGDRHARRDRERQPPRARRVPPLDVRRREHRRRGRRQPRAQRGRAARRARKQPRRARRAKASACAAARHGAAAGPALSAQGHRAVPRLPRRAGHRALRPPPLRRVAPRRDPRRLGVVAALPGDPREARDGVRGLQLRVAVHRHRAGRLLRRHARGEPRRVPRDRSAEQLAEIAGGNLRAGELERAKENLKGRIVLSMESTSNRMSRLGKSLITDTELLSLDRIIAEIDAVEPDEIASSRRCCSRPSGCPPPASGPTRRVHERSQGDQSRAGPRRRRSVKICLYGAGGKVGLGARARARGRRATNSSTRWARPTRRSTSPRPTPSSPTSSARSTRASRA